MEFIFIFKGKQKDKEVDLVIDTVKDNPDRITIYSDGEELLKVDYNDLVDALETIKRKVGK